MGCAEKWKVMIIGLLPTRRYIEAAKPSVSLLASLLTTWLPLEIFCTNRWCLPIEDLSVASNRTDLLVYRIDDTRKAKYLAIGTCYGFTNATADGR